MSGITVKKDVGKMCVPPPASPTVPKAELHKLQKTHQLLSKIFESALDDPLQIIPENDEDIEFIKNQRRDAYCIDTNLLFMKEAIDSDNIQGAKMFALKASACIQSHATERINYLNGEIETAEIVGTVSFSIAIAALAAEVIFAGYLLIPVLGAGGASGGTAVGGGLLYSVAEMSPALTALVYYGQRYWAQAQRLGIATTQHFDKLLAPLDRFSIPISDFFHRMVYSQTPILQRLHQWNLVDQPNLASFNKTLMTLYGLFAFFDVAEHSTDSLDAPPARLPGEEVVGRTTAGIYGNVSLAYLFLDKLPGLIRKRWAWNPLATGIFAIGHILSEYRVQHNSSGVEFGDEIDWNRTWGGNISATLTVGPMKALKLFWYENFGVLPATTGFVISSGLVNSALFYPIAKYLERGNVENFVEGLTIREFTLALPRKIVQGIKSPDSVLGLTTYFVSKIIENDIISRFYSLFAGTSLYRQPLHNFLSKNKSSEEFIEFCKKSLGSNRVVSSFYDIEEDYYEIIIKDILDGEFSEQELIKIIAYVDFILFEPKSIEGFRTGLAWLSTLEKIDMAMKTDGQENLNKLVEPFINDYRELRKIMRSKDKEITTIIEEIEAGNYDHILVSKWIDTLKK